MMGVHQSQNELFSYSVQLDKRVRPDHPLRRIAALVDFNFVRAETARFYGGNGHVSVDPAVVLKLMFLLFYDNVASERELMGIVAERLDYLWFLGYGLDDAVPNHSVLSKARARWGKEVFESFFVRIVLQCVEKGLVDGGKIHIDSSFVKAHAALDGTQKGPPELIAALKSAYQAQESKLSETAMPPGYEAVNDRVVSPTDPDASLMRRGAGGAKLCYHHHRVVDDAHGIITAIKTTPGSIVEQSQMKTLADQHQANTGQSVQTVVGDSKYGTVENFLTCQERGWRSHLADGQAGQWEARSAGIFPPGAFVYQEHNNTYLCPAGQIMKASPLHPVRQTWEYKAAAGACAQCALRAQCTRAKKGGRTLHRHQQQELLEQARSQSHSRMARRDRQRRQELAEGSFADAANNHGFKRARWRRLWRQQIQDWLIAAVQNIRLILKHAERKPAAAAIAAIFRRSGGPTLTYPFPPAIGMALVHFRLRPASR
jgi:transposase